MSSSNRTTSKGGKGAKSDTTKTQKLDRSDIQKIEKNKAGKGSGDKNVSQQNSESIRNAKYKDIPEDPIMKEKVSRVVEMTQRSEEDAFFALHECAFDINQAVNMLIESPDQEWVTSVKKKKSRQPASTNKTETTTTESGGGGGGTDEWQETPPAPTGNEREKSRNRGSGPPRMRGRGGWRGRENRENEKNLEGIEGGPRRGGRMSNGPSRGGGSGRGGRGGGRLGSRTFQSRDGGGSRGRNNFTTSTMETWNSNTTGRTAEENWDNEFPVPIDDWYNEEYTGSLAETKIFSSKTTNETTDVSPEKAVTGGEVTGMAPPQEVPSATQQLTQALELRNQQQQPVSGLVGSGGQTVQQMAQQQGHVPPMPGVGSLTAAQSQYLSQFTQQTSESVKAQQNQATGYSSNTQQYSNNAYNNTNYSSAGNYGNIQDHSAVQQTLPTRTKTQRARVPPPSKIPASAVEMPGDSNISYLDVQFGALDFGDETGFNALTDKYPPTSTSAMENTASVPASNLDLSVSQSSTLDGYTTSPPKSNQTQSSISSALTQSQMLSNADSIPQASGDHISSVSGSYAQSRSTASGSVPPSVSASLDIGKSSDVGHTYTQPPSNSYQSYQSQKSANSVYQSQNYNSNNYQTNSQVTSASSYVSSQPTNSYVNSNSGSYNNPSATGVNSYQNSSYSNSASSYQSGSSAFPSITQASANFPATANSQSTYQQSSTVYGSGSGLSNSTNYNVTSSNQYNSYNTSSTSHNHKMASAKDQTYDNSTSVNSTVTATTTTSVSASPALGLSNSQTSSNTAGSKVTTSSTAKSGVVTNIPPGVAPMIGTQYIMGQAGVPFYQQPMYSYEDIHVMPARVPPHLNGGVVQGAYYDLGYQTPTTLGTAREGNISSGAYSMSDSRFTRSDNNASPVPSTLSQQTSTQSHQAQPMLSATLPPGYAYFYNAGMMPGSFQYGAPTLYPQIPGATNAHGTTNINQYPKPSNYGSAYGAGYDVLNPSQEYTKSGYVSGTQTQSKTGGVGANAVTTGSSVATDLSVMYGKGHGTLGKVNSYDKQGFHSGTPPPFNLAGSQSAGIAPSGTYGPQMYIPTMPPHQQHHSTTLMHQPLHQMDMRHQARRMDPAYDSHQTPMAKDTAQEGNLSSGASSMSNSRITPRDNDASPASSTLSQQTSPQSYEEQPMLSETLPPNSERFYNETIRSETFEYGAPTFYPSYDAPGFYSGTPPPSNLADSQNADISPSSIYSPQLYIPTMPPQQHRRSTTFIHHSLRRGSCNYDRMVYENWSL